jgi:hypothetical protein
VLPAAICYPLIPYKAKDEYCENKVPNTGVISTVVIAEVFVHIPVEKEI